MNPLLTVIVVVVGGLLLSCALYVAIRARRRRESSVLAGLADVLPLPPAERILRLEQWMSRTDGPGVERAARLIILGCAMLDTGRRKQAARPFQVACHTEPRFGLALLLAFTCMKDESGGLLQTLMETWQEMHRPSFGGCRLERSFLDVCGANAASPPGSELARALGSLPSQALRDEIHSAMRNRPAWAEPLFGEQLA
ncbi:MAG: hypothetical protein JXQ73_20580 [Phycisphaerae bacterium]|nr:hypothetical protein [Phycisphaerae bacterium]